MTPSLGGVRAVVIVVGDLGRSPRTLYHALALAENGATVDLIGCLESPLHPAAQQADRLTVRPLPSLGSGRGRWPALRSARALVRLLILSISLSWKLLFVVKRPHLILVQNPPGIPTLPVAWLAARLRAATLVVDWHNLGWTILALKLGPRHPLVSVLRAVEVGFGRRADRHFCVSKAMRRELEECWEIADVRVFYDRPARFFSPAHRKERPPERLVACMSVPAEVRGTVADAFGDRAEALVVSSTSWGVDEDFGLLLDAAERYDEIFEHHPPRDLPRLRVLVSGKGPRKQHYEERIGKLDLRRVEIRTVWLPAADYPYLLAHADIGVCVHRSSSGLDLPMKLADMLGSGLPVCALDYAPCLSEVLAAGENGFVFRDAEGLADLLADLLEGFPRPTARLSRVRRRLLEDEHPNWSDEWKASCLPWLAPT